MKYLATKFIAASFLIFGAVSQSAINPSDPTWGWDEHKQLKCDQGYNKVSNYCIKCDESKGKFFDSVTKQCRKCPEGTQYIAKNQACECACSAPRSVDPKTNKCQCSGNRIFLNKECVCPQNLPLWNGKRCVACPPGTSFQSKDKQCYHCPEGFTDNPVTHMCQPALGH